MAHRLMIPRRWDDVTPAWMTDALSGSHPGVEVEGVELVMRDDGTNRRARFALTYRNRSGPETVFLKAADPDHAALNAATGGLFNESRLFRTGLTMPIEHPAVFVALIDEPGLDFLLVMEDVASRGGDPRDATRPLTIEQAADGVRGLARLHRKFWGHRLAAHGDDLAWLEPLAAWRGMRAGITIGLRRTADSIPVEVRELSSTAIEDCWVQYLATMQDEPHTLLHGDAHVGNTYVLPGDRVGFLDWQVVHSGHHALDLGYFLQGALTPDDRRDGEAGLVETYHEALELPDGERPNIDDIWSHYRASAAHGLALWMATAASDTWQRPEVSLPLARRYAEAFVDLETASAIARLAES